MVFSNLSYPWLWHAVKLTRYLSVYTFFVLPEELKTDWRQLNHYERDNVRNSLFSYSEWLCHGVSLFFPVLLKYVIIEFYAQYYRCLTTFKWFMYRFDVLCLELMKNASFEHKYWRLTKIHIGQKLKQISLCGWEIC